jgi:DnaJ like chaperone protein
MGIIGKIIGGTIGFALGGPLGAIAGAAFGHAFDLNNQFGDVDSRRWAGGGPDAYGGLSTEDRTQAAFFIAAFSMLAKLTRTDGQVTPQEMASIEKFMVMDLNLPPDHRMAAMNIFHAAMNSPETFTDFASQFYSVFRTQLQMLELMIDILIRVAVADGSLKPAEEAMIVSAVRLFGFSDTQYGQLKARYVKATGSAYAVLGCSPQDSNEQIKKCYRQRAAEFHPDKIASKGLPEEFTKFAQDKFREIQEAYDSIKAERGMR